MAVQGPTCGKYRLQVGRVLANGRVCREHYRLTLGVSGFHGAHAGQFVHLRPELATAESEYRTWAWDAPASARVWMPGSGGPMLRRAFSIAGLVRRLPADDVNIDVIYRVVGAGTKWLESLKAGDGVSVLGPLGNRFPMSQSKPAAWLVSGGVGLPPMLWLAEELRGAGKRIVAFCGARTEDLLPLTIDRASRPSPGADPGGLSCQEFSDGRTPVVVSTDDGSLGYKGHIGAAMTAYDASNPTAGNEVVVYTCGPEPMMRFVAEYCLARGIECYVCMERSMGCGTGMCQSCVVPVRDAGDPSGWVYRLCCTDGPVFDAADVLWERDDAK